MRRGLALLLFALGLALLGTAPASAQCETPAPRFRTQLADAAVVFTGKVSQVVGGREGDGRVVYVVQVARVYAGRAATETTVTSPASVDECGLQGVRRGRDYVFVAGAEPRSGVVEALSHEGTRRLRDGVRRTVRDVLGRGEPPVAPSELDPADEEPNLTRVDDSEPPSLMRGALPGAALAGVGLLVLLLARFAGRSRE